MFPVQKIRNTQHLTGSDEAQVGRGGPGDKEGVNGRETG